jgi:mono/diheme cytochrome c family protein
MCTLRRKIWLAIVLLIVAIMVCGYLWIDGVVNPPPPRVIDEIPTDVQPYSTGGRNGETLFKANCTSCHTMNRVLTGPALMGAGDRLADTLIEDFLWYPEKTVRGSIYLKELSKAFGNLKHPAFLNVLTKQDIADIAVYLKGCRFPPSAVKN